MIAEARMEKKEMSLKFKADLPNGVKEKLEREYREFIKNTPMTASERQEVLKWVKSGNSVYENGYYVCEENGRPMNCLDASRFMEALIEEIHKSDVTDMGEDESYECFVQPVYVGMENGKQ